VNRIFFSKKYAPLKLSIATLLIFSLVLGLVPLDILIRPLVNVPEAQAANDNKPVEVIEKRTETTKVFNNGDGTYKAKLYATPIHYKDNGKWVDIDLNIKQSPGDGYETVAAPFKARFGAKGKSDNLTSLEHNAMKVSFRLAEDQTADVLLK